MSIEVAKVGDAVRLTTDGPLLGTDRSDLTEIVAAHLSGGELQFDFDLARTDYIDSGGIGALVDAAKTVRNAGGRVRVLNLDGDIRALFELTRLSEILPLDEDDAGGAGRLAPRSPKPSPLRDAEDLRDD